jgi:hypothetical protein
MVTDTADPTWIWRDCEHCGASFGQPDDPGRKRRFCSGACRTAAYRARKRRQEQAEQQRQRRAHEQARRRYEEDARRRDQEEQDLVFRGYAAGFSWVSRASGNRSRVGWSG